MLSDMFKSENEHSGGRRPSLTVPTIHVDRCPSSDFLIARRGDPVWPIGDAEDWRAVSRLCEFRSIRIREVKGQPGDVRRQKGVVTGIGCARILEIARLYAHLTGRQFREGADVSLVSDLSRSAVVVTTFEYLTASLFQTLYSNARVRSVPGLICASGAEELRCQVLVRSILARPALPEEKAPWSAVDRKSVV